MTKRKAEIPTTEKATSGDTPNSHVLTNEQFWNLYLLEHQLLANCWRHVLGTALSWMVVISVIVWQHWWLLVVVPVVGYGLAWTGYLLIEGNRPVSIRYPLRSLLADYRLTWQMLTGGRRSVVSKEDGL